jgi:hypothetical protein
MDPFPGEDIQIFERDIPGQNLYGYSEQAISTVLPLETCQTMNRSWGYRITDTTYKSVDFLIKYLVQTAAKGANLLLNIGPRPDGTLPDESLHRLKAIGEWMDVYGETIYGTKAGRVPQQPWGVSTRKGQRNFLHIFKDTAEIFVPLANADIKECKTYPAGTPLKYRKVDGGIQIMLQPFSQEEKKSGVKVVEVDFPATDMAALEKSVREFFEKYPQATLQDVYKNNFQDYFGPAHIMARREGVLAYLNSELQQMDKEEERSSDLSGRKYYTPCGWRHNYYQVSLQVIKDGIMSVDEFADAFMAGGGAAPQVSQQWLDEWEAIKDAVKDVVPDLEGYKADAKKVDALLKEGKYVVHHSGKFEEAYRPHYRIIRGDIFENVVLPKILVGK